MVRDFRKKCTIAMEKMDQHRLLETLLGFMKMYVCNIKKRKKHTMQFHHCREGFAVALQKGEENVFCLLRDSSMQMSMESMLCGQSHVLYRKLLWSMSQICSTFITF